MGILTNFLKLLKPEPNDFVDVVKHISENYDKLDENAKTNNETLTNLNSNKLDKGTYIGKADDLDRAKLDKGTYTKKASDLDNDKYNKTGGKLTGTVEIVGGSNNNVARVDFSDENGGLGYIGVINSPGGGLKYIGIYDAKNNASVRLYEDGTTAITGNNLATENKEVIRAINETYNLEKGVVGAATINYIQTPGQKIYNQVYFDNSVYPPTPYVCVNPNTDITPTSNFILTTNANISMRAKRHGKPLLYNSGALIPNGWNAPAISMSEYEFLLVRVKRGVDTYSKNVIVFTAGDTFIEPGVILTITSAGQVIVKDNGSSDILTGLIEVTAYSFGYLL